MNLEFSASYKSEYDPTNIIRFVEIEAIDNEGPSTYYSLAMDNDNTCYYKSYKSLLQTYANHRNKAFDEPAVKKLCIFDGTEFYTEEANEPELYRVMGILCAMITQPVNTVFDSLENHLR